MLAITFTPLITLAGALAALTGLTGLALFALRSRFTIVSDVELGLRVRLGRLVGRVAPGLRFALPFEKIEIFDLRAKAIALATQEVTTKDRVPVKASVTLTYRLVSPERARESTTSLENDLYRAAQVALRETLTLFELETLLEARAQASAGVQERLAPECEALGVEIVRAVVLDIVVRGELKSALSDVVRARAEARAGMERARGESAALRSLANAARMLREHGGLYELRLLEAAQKAAQGANNTLVLGLGSRIDGLDGKGLELAGGKE